MPHATCGSLKASVPVTFASPGDLIFGIDVTSIEASKFITLLWFTRMVVTSRPDSVCLSGQPPESLCIFLVILLITTDVVHLEYICLRNYWCRPLEDCFALFIIRDY